MQAKHVARMCGIGPPSLSLFHLVVTAAAAVVVTAKEEEKEGE